MIPHELISIEKDSLFEWEGHSEEVSCESYQESEVQYHNIHSSGALQSVQVLF